MAKVVAILSVSEANLNFTRSETAILHQDTNTINN